MSRRSKQRSRLRGQLCVYCGVAPATTRDDIPPKCFFLKPTGRLLLVPSCRPCNEGSSKNDEYARNSFVFRADLADHPVGGALNEVAFRGLRMPEKAGMRQALLRATELRRVETPAGLYLGIAPTYEARGEPLFRLGVRITKALFWFESARNDLAKRLRLPDNYEVNAWVWDHLDAQAQSTLDPVRRDLLGQPAHRIGAGDVFRYHFRMFPADDPFVSIWLLVFYGKVGFVCMTMPASLKSGQPGDG